MLEAGLEAYQVCLVADKEKLVKLLDFDLEKKVNRLERVKAKRKESILAFDRFQAQQKEMFDKFMQN